MTIADDVPYIPCKRKLITVTKEQCVLAEQQQRGFTSFQQLFSGRSSHSYNLKRINIELKNIYDNSNIQIAPGHDRRDRQQNKDKYELKTSQLESSTLCTTNG
ncbi:PREDICTED: uncharacterized protein LOC108769721 [Trachymyrmex cornetzi]|uniref:uncharacterized protein LOC108769721 n=1 Tax=Trachymyrmex cornetzi TaxID=471704 RepID=UPI00084F7E6B|nr:PREDICTED: uncharacterized protein LOC108769721 [Trachymyrmex cornetzi]